MDMAFFDIDNTLIWRDPKTGWGNEATEVSKHAIRRFCELGNVALLSTGRAPQGIPACLKDLPFRGMLCFDGALALLDGKCLPKPCATRWGSSSADPRGGPS